MPAWLYGVLNPTIKGVLRSPLGRGLNGAMTVVTFTGRRSGKRYSTPVGYSRDGNTVTLLIHRPWWNNFRGGANVALYLDGRDRQGRAVAVDDPAEIVGYLRQRIQSLGGVKNVARLGLSDLDPTNDQPSDADLLHAARGAALVRVELAA